MTFDRKGDYEQGREDALNGFPRTSTRSHYRKGYDRGLRSITDDDPEKEAHEITSMP